MGSRGGGRRRRCGSVALQHSLLDAPTSSNFPFWLRSRTTVFFFSHSCSVRSLIGVALHRTRRTVALVCCDDGPCLCRGVPPKPKRRRKQSVELDTAAMHGHSRRADSISSAQRFCDPACVGGVTAESSGAIDRIGHQASANDATNTLPVGIRFSFPLSRKRDTKMLSSSRGQNRSRIHDDRLQTSLKTDGNVKVKCTPNGLLAASALLIAAWMILSYRISQTHRLERVLEEGMAAKKQLQHHPSVTLRRRPITDTEPGSTSSCILMMDDNHWFVEWLAYHWTTVNLKSMILAIDQRSTTSPLEIIDRWHGKIDFELWNDTHFFHPSTEGLNLQEINLLRQKTFFAKCIRTLKARNASWTLFTDADEFILINPRASSPKNELYRTYVPQPDHRGYILSFAKQESREKGTTCFSMGRLQLSPDESGVEEVQRDVPAFLNGSDFLTLRWLTAADNLVGPKNFLDLSSVDDSILPMAKTHQHRVIPEICAEAGHTWTRKNSLLQIYHYLGTKEQFNFRNDSRLSLKDAGRNNRFDRYIGQSIGKADDARPWLSLFLKLVGKKDALYLLDGLGRTTGWAGTSNLEGRFADV